MRTLKIEALHRAIDWFNTHKNTNLIKHGIDKSEIDSNSLLSGFANGDGNFSVSLIDRKKRGLVTNKIIQIFFRLEIRQSYHREVLSELGDKSYFGILNKIFVYLGVNLYSRSRLHKNKIFHAFIVVSHNLKSHNKVIEYFDKYPLCSSKYMAYKDWKFVKKKQF